MPPWLATFLHEWGPAAGIVTFALGLIAAIGRGFWSLFASGALISRSRHQAELSFYEAQVRLVQAAADRRMAELRQDLEDLVKERDVWRDRAWRAADAGQSLIKRDTPPHGVRRPDSLP